MATTTKWSTTTLQTALLTTGLNSLANGGFATSATYDNTTALDMFGDFELVLGSLAPTAGGYCALHIQESVDGTNFETNANLAYSNQLLCVWPLDTATSAKRLVVRNVQIPPSKFQVTLANQSGVTLNASGNTVKMLTYDLTAT